MWIFIAIITHITYEVKQQVSSGNYVCKGNRYCVGRRHSGLSNFAVNDESRHTGRPHACVFRVPHQVVACVNILIYLAIDNLYLRVFVGKLCRNNLASAQCGQPSRTKTSSTFFPAPSAAATNGTIISRTISINRPGQE